MNMDNFPSEQDIFENIEHLKSNLEDTQQKLVTSAEIMRPIYEDAVDTIESQLRTICESEATEQLVADQKASLDAQLAEVDSLQASGFLDDDKSKVHKAHIRSADEYRLLNLIQGSGSIITDSIFQVVSTPQDDSVSETSIVENKPVELLNDSAGSLDITVNTLDSLEEKTKVSLTVFEGDNGTILKLGARGKSVRLSHASDKETDYTDQRIELLQIFVDRQGERLTKENIVECMSTLPDTHVGQLKHYNQSIAWLKKLTFRRSPLIRQDGIKRGAGYTVNEAFLLDLTHTQGKSVQEKKTSSPVDAKATSETSIKPPKRRKQTLEQQIRNGELPLRETNVLVQSLHLDRDLLRMLGIPTIPIRVATEINEASNQYDIDNNITRTNTDTARLAVERRQVASDFRRLFDDAELFSSYVTSAPEDHPTFEFVSEYLLKIDEETWDLLLEQVLVKEETISSGTSFNSSINGRIYTIELPNGRTFERVIDLTGSQKGELLETTQRFDPVMRAIIDAEIDNVESNEDLDETTELPENESLNPIATDELEQTESIETSATDESKANEEQPTTTKKVEKKIVEAKWKSELRASIGEILTKLEENELVFEGTMPAKNIKNQLKFGRTLFGTIEAFKRLEDNGILKVPHGINPHDYQMDLSEAVIMLMFNSNKQTFTKSNKRKQKQALALVKSCVKSMSDGQ